MSVFRTRLIASLVLHILAFFGLYKSENSLCDKLSFQCHNGLCVSTLHVCDGRNDCGDYSDEVYCDGVKSFENGNHKNCSETEYTCHDRLSCIPASWVCDGSADCNDGSDEIPSCHPLNCTGYPCRSTKECIPLKWHCDGTHDCPDNSDEIGCDISIERCKSEEGRFLCSDGLCLPPISVCNGERDCLNGEDEDRLCTSAQSNCTNFGCSGKCMRTPNGPKCFCALGYQLSKDGKICKDVNECETLDGLCSQGCTNTKGSYVCFCREGYQLQADKFRCKTTEDPVLLVSYPHAIDTFNVKQHEEKKILQSPIFVDELAYDGISKTIYWVQKFTEHSLIKKRNLASGHPAETFIHKGLSRVEDLDVDWINKKIYFSDLKNRKIITCELDASLCIAVIENVKTSSIALIPEEGLMFWSVYKSHTGIMRSWMDGKNQEMVVNTEDGWPHGLFFDKLSSKLFWSDVEWKRIHTYDIRSNKTKILVDGGKFHPYDVVVFDDWVFWTDLKMNSVLKCNKFTGKEIMLVFKSSERPLNIEPIQSVLYDASILNPCIMSECSHMCLLADTKIRYSCVCPAGMYLNSNGKSCLDNEDDHMMVLSSSTTLMKIKEQTIGPDLVTEHPFSYYGQTVGAIVYVKEQQTYYISDLEKDIIYAVNKSKDERVIVGQHLDTVKGISFDNIGKNLYWTDAALGTIEVIKSSGESRKRLYENLIHPTEIVVDTHNGVGFVILFENAPKIVIIDPAGLHRPQTIAENLGQPKSLSLDGKSPLLFWIDLDFYKIEYYNFETGKRGIFQDHLKRPIALTVGKNAIYWINEQDSINSATFKSIVNPETFSISRESGLTPLLISASNFSSKLSERQCFNGKPVCEQLCLQTLHSYQCTCQLGYVLNNDGFSCKEKTCNAQEFMCRASKVCIPKSWKCDNVEDCHDIIPHDLSDEQNCFECLENEFTCNETGECYDLSWKCDGAKDCEDGSDEDESICHSLHSVTDKPEECSGFSCGQGQCIYSSWVCDNDVDCNNGADEENCGAGRCSNATDFECSPNNCIPKEWICDGNHDCLHDEDEINCTFTPRDCLATEFKCRDDHCIHPSLVCDQDIDCPDGSDEDDTVCGYDGACSENQWKCSESKTCIRSNQRCDSVVDCEKGEDEIGCSETRQLDKACQANTFMCDFSTCLPESWVCDQSVDCIDGSDENAETCKLNATEAVIAYEPIECSEDQFHCVSGECIDVAYHCDGHSDCQDYSDEGSQCDVCSRINGGCSHICENSNHGPICKCPPGLKLINNYVCDDVDECEEWGSCSQLCINTKGSYKCSCQPGFRLDSDGKRCRSADSSEIMLLFAVNNEVRQTSSDGYHLNILHRVTDNSTVVDFSYSRKEHMLYLITSNFGYIYVVDRSGGERKIETRFPATNLEFDWLTGNLYYSNINREIRVCNVTGKDILFTTIIEDTMGPVISMVLAPNEGIMFWSVWDSENLPENPIIWRSNMDGTEKQMLVNKKVFQPNSLNIDVGTARLFWSELELNHIESANYDGSHRMKILKEVDLGNPDGIAIFEDSVYWISKNFEHVMTANKFSDTDTKFVRSINKDAKKLKLIHPANQLEGANSCKWESTNCQYMCVLTTSFYTCACPDGFKLNLFNFCEVNLDAIKDFIKDVTTSLEATGSKCNLECENGGTCSVINDTPVCRCMEGYDGNSCEYSRTIVKSAAVHTNLNNSHKLALGIGVSLSVALVILFAYTCRTRIKAAVTKKREDDLSILYKNNDCKDTTPLTDMEKPNNISHSTSEMTRASSSKTVLSFNNPLSDTLSHEDTAILMRNDSQFYMWAENDDSL